MVVFFIFISKLNGQSQLDRAKIFNYIQLLYPAYTGPVFFSLSLIFFIILYSNDYTIFEYAILNTTLETIYKFTKKNIPSRIFLLIVS